MPRLLSPCSPQAGSPESPQRPRVADLCKVGKTKTEKPGFVVEMPSGEERREVLRRIEAKRRDV